MTALTAYFQNTAAADLSTAEDLTAAAPASETSVASGQFAKSATGWTELYSQGANATLAGSEPAASGHGLLWDVTTLEGQQLAAGTWTPKLKLSTGGGTFTADLHVRAFRYHAGVYTQLTSGNVATDLVLSGQALSSTATVYSFAGATLDAMTLVKGDKLYIDVVLNITVGSASNTAAQRVINLFLNGGANDAVTTPGYTAAPAVTPGMFVDWYQLPGVGGTGQRKRRNPVNAPRTWRHETPPGFAGPAAPPPQVNPAVVLPIIGARNTYH